MGPPARVWRRFRRGFVRSAQPQGYRVCRMVPPCCREHGQSNMLVYRGQVQKPPSFTAASRRLEPGTSRDRH